MSEVSYHFQLSMNWFRAVILIAGIYDILILHIARVNLSCEITRSTYDDFHRTMELWNTMLERTSRTIWYNLSLQMDCLDNIGQYPIQRNLNSVHHFPTAPTADYFHCEIFSSCPVRISPGITRTHCPLCFPCDSSQKGSSQFLCSHLLNTGTVFKL